MSAAPARLSARIVGGPLRRLRHRLDPRRNDVAPELPERDQQRVMDQIDKALKLVDLNSQRGEAASVATTYGLLDAEGRGRFLRALAARFGPSPRAVDSAVAAWMAAGGDPAARQEAVRGLREAATPSYARLFQLFTGLQAGVKLLVDLRAELRRLDLRDPELGALDESLAAHLGALFDVGLLELQRITWDSPAALLEKLIQYEAVHAIESWGDLKNRLASDRRCYAFFHPAMPGEPLVFVEIALTRRMAAHLAPLLDESAPVLDPAEADTANFYSITSCQPGLTGVNLGNELLEAVVEQLSSQLPSLRTFATLSPIPGFASWLDHTLDADDLHPKERAALPPLEELRPLLRSDAWLGDEKQSAGLRKGLTALCARYLLSQRPDGRVLDPVGNFHLSNGASVDRVNWLANPSPAGLSLSHGLMVNYRYDPERIAAHAHAYATDRVVAASDAVRELVD